MPVAVAAHGQSEAQHETAQADSGNEPAAQGGQGFAQCPSCSAHDCGGKQQFGQMVGHGGEELQTFAGVGADNDFAHLGIVDGIVDPEQQELAERQQGGDREQQDTTKTPQPGPFDRADEENDQKGPASGFQPQNGLRKEGFAQGVLRTIEDQTVEHNLGDRQFEQNDVGDQKTVACGAGQDGRNPRKRLTKQANERGEERKRLHG